MELPGLQSLKQGFAAIPDGFGGAGGKPGEGERMNQEFCLAVSDADVEYLHALTRKVIADALGLQAPEPVKPAGGVAEQELGAFVTLNKGGGLRGCIGSLVGNGPLEKTVAAMARAAAFEDPRFPPLRAEEFSAAQEEISLMGPISPCRDPEAIVIGRHGLIMRRGSRQGLLLPQVAVAWNWDRETFLSQTCRKAGLPPQAWQEAWQKDDTQLFWFEAIVI